MDKPNVISSKSALHRKLKDKNPNPGFCRIFLPVKLLSTQAGLSIKDGSYFPNCLYLFLLQFLISGTASTHQSNS